MIGLPQNYFFSVYNDTGQTLPVSGVIVTVKRNKFDSQGNLSYESPEATGLVNLATLATSAYASGSIITNATNLYLGADVVAHISSTQLASSGDVSVFLHRATDGGTYFDTLGLGEIIIVLPIIGSGISRRGCSL